MTRSPYDSRLYYYFVLLAAHIAVVWLSPYVPTQDGPSHIYNLAILKDLLNGGKDWGAYFTCAIECRTESGISYLLLSAPSFFPPLIAGKIFISCYIVLMG